MFQRAYDLLMADVDYEAIYTWMKPYLKPNDFIIDAGCGSGYYLVEILLRGHEAIGIDIDTEMLSLAREKLIEKQLPIHLYEHDIRTSYQVKTDVIVMLFDVVNYFKGAAQIFKKAYQALNKNGRLIIDIYKEENLKLYDHFLEVETEPISYQWSTKVDHQKLIHELIIQDEKVMIRQYIYPLSYYLDLLTKIGFSCQVEQGPDPRKDYIIAYKK